MKEAKITLVGCGQLGSRHLQAIARLNMKLKIQVVEPSGESQKIGKERLDEILSSGEGVQVEWLKDISSVDRISDLTIVATTAGGRSDLVNKLLRSGHKRFLIEKMVCQSAKEYERLLESFAQYKAKGWIDCTRRYFPPYDRLIKLIREENPIALNVTAGNLGLGCNVVHFLDLFSTCTKNGGEVKLSGEGLWPELLPNRRGKDLVEFAGTITARINDNFASVTFHPESNAGIAVDILSRGRRIFVDEGKARGFMSTGQNDWQWEDLHYKELFTSELTTKIADSIINTDACELPPIEELYHIHKELFRIFNEHIKLVTAKYPEYCPIT